MVFFLPCHVKIFLRSSLVVYVFSLLYLILLMLTTALPFPRAVHSAIVFFAHPGVMLVLGYGMLWQFRFRLKRVTGSIDVFLHMLRRVMLPGLLTAVVVFACILFFSRHEDYARTIVGMGSKDEIHSQAYLEENGHYYLVVNKSGRYEITESQFNRLELDLFRVFATFWVGFSFFSLCFWVYIQERLALESQKNSGG